MMPATFLAPHAQSPAALSPIVPVDVAMPWALSTFNALLALGADAGGIRPGAEGSAHTLRLRLHQGGVAMRGWPLPPSGSPRPSLPAGLAAALALAGSDADLDRLRAWTSLAAATRWAAEVRGQPMPPEAFFGAALRTSPVGTRLSLHLADGALPLVLPVLNLTTYDWRYVAPDDRRPAREVALDVGALWQALPTGPGHAAHLGEMAAVLLRVLEQGRAAPIKRLLLGCAAAELHREAGLPGLPDGLQRQPLFGSWPEEAGPTAPSSPKLQPLAASVAAPTQAGPPSPVRAETPLVVAPPAPNLKRTTRWAHGGSRSAPASAGTGAQSATPPPQPDAEGAGADAAQPTTPVSAHALRLALEALAETDVRGAAGAVAGCQHREAARSVGSTPTLLGDTAPASRGSGGSASPLEVWTDAPEQPTCREAGKSTTPPFVDASSPAERELRNLSEAPAAVAWSLLADASRSVTQQLSEAQALRLLAEPPATPLPAESVALAALWLRRLASEPDQARQFLANHEEAVVRWTQVEPLLRDLGRVLGCWRNDGCAPPAAESWMVAAGRAEHGAPLLQTLASLGLDNPLYDEMLLYVARRAKALDETTVTELVRLVGDKLANKRAASRVGRQIAEHTLAYVLTCKPAACHALDFSKPYAWRVLSGCRGEAGAQGLRLALAPALRGQGSAAPRATPGEMLRLVVGTATPDLQLAAAAMLLNAYPRDLHLAKLVATLLVEHEEALTSVSDRPGTTFEPRAVRSLVDVCAAVAEAWHGEGRAVAEVVWYALERVGFVLPHFLARGDYDAAASILHRAHGHPHLTLISLQALAKDGAAEVTEQLGRALDGVVDAESKRVARKAEALRAARPKGAPQPAPSVDAQLAAHAERELARRIVGNNAWKAAAATRALLDWAEAEPALEAFFTADGSASEALRALLYRVGQRQAHGPWQRGERPIQTLAELLRGDARRREQLAQFLVTQVADDTASWNERALLLPVVQVTLDATSDSARRRALAETFGTAFGLWRVELATAAAPDIDATADARRAARAAAAYALTPTLLANVAAARLGPAATLASNVRCARVHAALIHLLREPEHCAWRTPHLLAQVAALGALTAQELHRTARSALRDVATEAWATGSQQRRSDLTVTTFGVAWSVCQSRTPDAALALALLDGLLQVMDASDDREGSFHMLRPMLHASRGASSAVDARERQLDVLLRHLWVHTLRAKVPAPKTGELTRRVASAEIFSAGLAQEVCLGLHTWLDAAEPEGLARRYAALAELWYPAADDRLFEEPGYKVAAAAIHFACTDPDLRERVEGAVHHPPGVRPLLRVG